MVIRSEPKLTVLLKEAIWVDACPALKGCNIEQLLNQLPSALGNYKMDHEKEEKRVVTNEEIMKVVNAYVQRIEESGKSFRLMSPKRDECLQTVLTRSGEVVTVVKGTSPVQYRKNDAWVSNFAIVDNRYLSN